MNDIALYVLQKGKVDGVSEAVSALAPGYTFKGAAASASALPTTGNENGDLWIVTDEGNAQYVWNSGEWLKLNEGVAITTAQIDALFT